MDSLLSYAAAFGATLVLELATAWMLRFRQRSELVSVFWVNVFSHPLLHYILWLLNATRRSPIALPELCLLEVAVVLLEWWLLCFALPRHRAARLLLLSATMNSVSFLTGLAISALAVSVLPLDQVHV